MNYLLLKRYWVDAIRREYWFHNECVAYPVEKETPLFLVGAYFVPDFRIEQHPKGTQLLLGTHESIAFARLQLCNDYRKELLVSQT